MILRNNIKDLPHTKARSLRPLIRLCLQAGISYKTFAEVVKWLFIDTAAQEFRIKGRKQTDSRISVITGLSRKEVKRARKITNLAEITSEEKYNRAIRVIDGWISENECKTATNGNKGIPIHGDGFTFNELVQRYSGDVPTRAVLDELLRIGMVKKVSGNRIKLVESGHSV